MLETLTKKTMRAGRTVTVAAVATLAALGLVWCIAVIVHLYCLRRGLDACCVDD